MTDHRVNSFESFHQVVQTFKRDRGWLFRGHNSLDWPLIPKIARPEYIKLDRKHFFESFKRRAIEFVTIMPVDDWDWLAFAQHHGLPTALLDWSYNPLVAAFFAAFPLQDCDCCIYAYRPLKFLNTEKFNPQELAATGKIYPKGIAPRIVRQGGVFTYHNPPETPLTEALGPRDKLQRIVIDRSYRNEMIYELDRYCINEMTLFPDVDGLAKYMSWSARKEVRAYWGPDIE